MIHVILSRIQQQFAAHCSAAQRFSAIEPMPRNAILAADVDVLLRCRPTDSGMDARSLNGCELVDHVHYGVLRQHSRVVHVPGGHRALGHAPDAMEKRGR